MDGSREKRDSVKATVSRTDHSRECPLGSYVFFAVVSSFLKKQKQNKKKTQREPLLHVLVFVNEKTYLSVIIK